MHKWIYPTISHPPKKAGLELSRKIIKDLSSNSGSFQEGTLWQTNIPMEIHNF